MLRRTRAKLTVATLAALIALGSLVSSPLRAASQTTSPVIAAAGDIACDPASPDFNGGSGSGKHCRELATSNLLVGADTAQSWRWATSSTSAGRSPRSTSPTTRAGVV